jgi:hypothetical protein
LGGGFTRNANVPILKKTSSILYWSNLQPGPESRMDTLSCDNTGSGDGDCHYYHYALDAPPP